MASSRLIAALAALFAALTASNFAHARPAGLFSCGGLPCADLDVGGGRTLKLAIDTGDALSILDLAAAKAAGLELSPLAGPDQKPVPGAFSAIIKGARLGDDQLGDISVIAVDLGAQMAAGHLPPANGILSYVALKDRRLVLDYRRHTVRVLKSEPKSACGDNCGVLTYPTFGPKGPPIVAATGFKVNGQPITVQVDTLYGGTLLIYSTAIDKLRLGDQVSSTSIRNFPFTDGGVDMIEAKASTESFGSMRLMADAPLYFPTPKVHQPAGLFDGTAGSGLFQGHVVTFDFPANQFWIS